MMHSFYYDVIITVLSAPPAVTDCPASLESRQIRFTALLAPTVKSQYEHMWIYVCNYKSALQEREMLCWTVLQISSLLLICCSLHYREVIGLVRLLSAHCCCPSKSDRILTLSKLKRFFFSQSLNSITCFYLCQSRPFAHRPSLYEMSVSAVTSNTFFFLKPCCIVWLVSQDSFQLMWFSFLAFPRYHAF